MCMINAREMQWLTAITCLTKLGCGAMRLYDTLFYLDVLITLQEARISLNPSPSSAIHGHWQNIVIIS